MIYTEILTIGGREFLRTYSDSFMLLRDGVEYDEAVDPADSGRTYTESTTPKQNMESEAAAEDYQAALAEFGVKV